MSRTVYLAGPMTGISYVEAIRWRREVTDLLRPFAIRCISPVRGEEALSELEVIRPTAYAKSLFNTNKAVTARDLFDVRQCDVVLANMSQAVQVSVGTVIEIAWAYLLGKMIILVPDSRGICAHGMFDEMIQFKAKDLEEAIKIILVLLDT